jgi:cAMP phosphodiesterase
MRMRVLGCSGGSAPARLLSCYLFDDTFAVDAGALTTALEIQAQTRVAAIALTHAHLDHVWTFPFLLANRFGLGCPPCHVYADSVTLKVVRESLFNNRVWPDFAEILDKGSKVVDFSPLDPGPPVRILDRYEVSSIPLRHTIPSYALHLRRDGRSAIVCGDTGTTDDVWRVANATDDLRGILVECSFPSDYGELAETTGHLTPALLAGELKKLRRDVPVYVTHVKPEVRLRVIDELRGLHERRLRILEDGQQIDF